MKAKRQELILRAIDTGGISTQGQLLAYLRASGIEATQATVSRDVRELGLRKSLKQGGKTVYEFASEGEQARTRQKCLVILASAVLSVDGAGHIVCVRCAPGMAQAACAALDAMPPGGVVGSLAGEDTIFLLCRDEAAMRAAQAEVRALLPEACDSSPQA
jgi:transcriptional regulator of arginine metabolism